MDFDSPLPPDPYAALGLTKDAPAASIKSSYRKLALKFHPDKVTDESLKQQSVDEFHRIQQAYDIIGDEDRRARYDALIRLSDLKRQTEDLRGGPGSSRGVRTAAYDVRTPTAARPVYTTARPSKFDERRPKYYEDDEYTRAPASKYPDYDYAGKRPPTAVPPRSERARADPRDAEDRKRAERRREREAEVRDGRSRKYDISEDPYSQKWEEDRRRRADEEREQRRADDLRRERASTSTERKYVDHEAGAQQYMQNRTSRTAAEVRPSASRRPSAREVPSPYASVRRSQAPSKEKELRDRERERENLVRERIQQEKERLELEREKDRAEDRRRAEAKTRERDTEREPVAAAPRARNIGNVEPFERRPPALATQKTSPAMGQPGPSARLPRSYTENIATLHSMTDATPAPAFNRVSSMPIQPSNSSTRRAKEAFPAHSSKLRGPVLPTDSGYSSPSNAVPDAFNAHAPPPTAHPVKEKRYHYPSDSTDSTESAKRSPYRRTEIREPGSSSRRARSPSKERLKTADMMAHLATGLSRPSARPSASYGVEVPIAAIRPTLAHAATTRAVPTLARSSRSPERSSRRARSKDRDADRGRERRGREADYAPRDKYYGERGPGLPRGESYNSSSYTNPAPKVAYANGGKPYSLDNVNFGQDRRGSASGRGPSERERGYDNFQKPGYYRSNTLPVH